MISRFVIPHLDPTKAPVVYRSLDHTNLRYRNLYGMNLAGVDLTGSDISYASLQGANLPGAKLANTKAYQTNFSSADLTGADLSSADLNDANFTFANLTKATMHGATSCRADLRDAALRHADLRGCLLLASRLHRADLTGADIRGTDLNGVRGLEEATFRDVIAPAIPQGELVGWKKCANGLVVQVRVPADARRSCATSSKHRAERVEVLGIFYVESGGPSPAARSIYDRTVYYRVGATVEADKWDDLRWRECSSGIHFFLDRREAENYQ